jgi:hypothetical protein
MAILNDDSMEAVTTRVRHGIDVGISNSPDVTMMLGDLEDLLDTATSCRNALKLMTLDPSNRDYLGANDPKALEQIRKALGEQL